METLPSPSCQSFYFPHYQMFSSVELSPFIQLSESQPRSYCTGGGGMGGKLCIDCVKKERREKRGGGGWGRERLKK